MSMDQQVLNIPPGQQKGCTQGLLQIRLQALGVPVSFMHQWLVHAELRLSFLFNSWLSHRAGCVKVNSLKITTGKMSRSKCNQSVLVTAKTIYSFQLFLALLTYWISEIVVSHECKEIYNKQERRVAKKFNIVKFYLNFVFTVVYRS